MTRPHLATVLKWYWGQHDFQSCNSGSAQYRSVHETALVSLFRLLHKYGKSAWYRLVSPRVASALASTLAQRTSHHLS
jgi:hypothetical protein